MGRRWVDRRRGPFPTRRKHEASSCAHRRAPGKRRPCGRVRRHGPCDHPGSTTLTFVERNNLGTFEFVDLRPRSFRRGEPRVSPGDMFMGSTPLFNAANTRREGKLFFKCTAITGAKKFERATFQCEATARLSNGTLAVSVLFTGGVTGGPVIGGTGALRRCLRQLHGGRAQAHLGGHLPLRHRVIAGRMGRGSARATSPRPPLPSREAASPRRS